MQKALAASARNSARLPWNQDYVDLLVGVAIAAASVVGAYQAGSSMDVLGVSLLLLQTLPVAYRRHNPIRVLLITGSAITLHSVLGYPTTVGFLGVLLAFYTVAAHETRRQASVSAIITAGGIAVSFASYIAFNSITSIPASLVGTYASFGMAWLIGDNLRVRRAYTAELEQRAVTLEREREDRAELAVAQERGRIARELHDVVAHHISVMVVQTAAARRICDKEPDTAREALAAVEEAGRTALAEMRRMLEVLRTETAGMGPQPGLGDLDRLAEKVRDAGLPVEVAVSGSARPLPAGMELAAYRIIQEALTNVVKHAGRASAGVAVRYAEDTLDIEVSDDGRGAAAPLLNREEEDDGGHGLVGMQERVALYGGKLETGPLFPGGYRVHASFPLEPARASAPRRPEEPAPAKAADEARRTRERRSGGQASADKPASPSDLVRPRVIPPLIGRVVPPHIQAGRQQRPATPRGTRQTQARTQPRPPDEGSASRTGSEEP